MLPGLIGLAGFSGTAAAGGGWSPSSLSPTAWWDADAISGADGSSVNTWNDSSGNNWFISRSSGTAPVLRHNSLNSLKTLEFGGPTSAAVMTVQNTSAYVLAGATSASYFAVFILDADPPGGTTSTGHIMGANWGAGTPHLPFTDGTIYDGFATSARKTVGNPASSMTSARILNVDSASANFTTRMDGTQIFNTGTNTVSLPTATRQVAGGSGNYLDGKIAEILVFNSVLAQADREKVEGYLAHKWGLTGNLPGAHPYKTNPPT